MPIYKNGKDFKIAKSDNIFDLATDTDIATEQEMKNYILQMPPANISANGSDLIIEFEPFPKKYVNYMTQRQYKGRRTQVFWQLVRYVGKSVIRRTNVFSDSDLSDNSWRFDETSDLYNWTFPTRLIRDSKSNLVDGTMKPYVFNMTPEQATQGKIIWYGGYTIIDRFVKRPWLARYNTTPRKIAIILGVSRHGMRDSSTPWVYKKSNDFEYNDQGPIIPTPPEGIPLLVSNAELLLELVEGEYKVSFSNIDPDLVNYAEENKNTEATKIFIQTFDYRGGTRHKRKRGLLEKRKKAKNPAKSLYCAKTISAQELLNGIIVTDILPLSDNAFRPRYKYEAETFHNVSIALVLANKGMNEGFHTYKESNKINILI